MIPQLENRKAQRDFNKVICSLCNKTVEDVKSGYYTCNYWNINCEFNCCKTCFVDWKNTEETSKQKQVTKCPDHGELNNEPQSTKKSDEPYKIHEDIEKVNLQEKRDRVIKKFEAMKNKHYKEYWDLLN